MPEMAVTYQLFLLQFLVENLASSRGETSSGRYQKRVPVPVQQEAGQGWNTSCCQAVRQKKPYETKLREYSDALFDLGLY
jgi:hypothetical protein